MKIKNAQCKVEQWHEDFGSIFVLILTKERPGPRGLRWWMVLQYLLNSISIIVVVEVVAKGEVILVIIGS